MLEVKCLSLQVTEAKTQAVLFYEVRTHKLPPLRIRRECIKIGTSMKYLDMIIDSRWCMAELRNFRYAETKACKIARTLKIMPNLFRPFESKRRLYANIINSILMYSAPVWSDELTKLTTKNSGPMRHAKDYCASGYHDIQDCLLYEAALLLARILPAHLMTAILKRT